MPTDKQREANKRNAQKSTGPRTGEGKRKSSLNGIRHGLFAKNYTMSPEEKLEHDQLLQSYLDHYLPEDPITLDLVEELAMAKTRQKRAWAIEAAYWRLELWRQRESQEKDFPDETIDGRMALALEWLVDESNGLESLRRYEGQLHRQWHKCLAALERRLPPKNDKLQSEPNSAERPAAQPITSGEAVPQTAPISSTPVSSTPQCRQPHLPDTKAARLVPEYNKNGAQ